MSLLRRQKPDAEKALETILYVAERIPNYYRTLKMIYFADQLHLSQHGRLLYGDSYCAMNSGPVPSLAYDIIKQVQGKHSRVLGHAEEAFELVDYTIVPLREPVLDLLSESERHCLDEAIAQNGSLSSRELKLRSHDAAWASVIRDRMIPLEAIVDLLPNADEVRDYLRGG